MKIGAWWILDIVIRRYILRDAKVNQPLNAGQLARFNWPTWANCASVNDAVLGGGQKRFSGGGVFYTYNTSSLDQILAQMLYFAHLARHAVPKQRPQGLKPLLLGMQRNVAAGARAATHKEGKSENEHRKPTVRKALTVATQALHVAVGRLPRWAL